MGTHVDNSAYDPGLIAIARFLGEVLTGWRVPVVAALAALIVWDVVAGLTYRHNLRLPFLVLYLARLSTPKQTWQVSFKRWKAELWHTLTRTDRLWVTRFLMGMIFAVPLALGGARHTAKAEAEGVDRQRSRAARELRRLFDSTLRHWVAIFVVSPGGVFASWLKVQVQLVGWSVWLSWVIAIVVCLAWVAFVYEVYRRLRKARDREETRE
ncbi:hypothetical protein [Streptomyces longwoodensis]|uniref:hypothetical protein n=1 Tax=Streptomyces longwoodensis TaxID=68231 RepID=UPI00340B0861